MTSATHRALKAEESLRGLRPCSVVVCGMWYEHVGRGSKAMTPRTAVHVIRKDMAVVITAGAARERIERALIVAARTRCPHPTLARVATRAPGKPSLRSGVLQSFLRAQQARAEGHPVPADAPHRRNPLLLAASLGAEEALQFPSTRNAEGRAKALDLLGVRAAKRRRAEEGEEDEGRRPFAHPPPPPRSVRQEALHTERGAAAAARANEEAATEAAAQRAAAAAAAAAARPVPAPTQAMAPAGDGDRRGDASSSAPPPTVPVSGAGAESWGPETRYVVAEAAAAAAAAAVAASSSQAQ